MKVGVLVESRPELLHRTMIFHVDDNGDWRDFLMDCILLIWDLGLQSDGARAL